MSGINPASTQNVDGLVSAVQAERNVRIRVPEPPARQLQEVKASSSLTEVKVGEVLEELREFLGSQESMSFSIHIDSELKEPVISVVDELTGERMLQVPTEQALKISKAILEMRGLFVDKSA